MILRDFLCWYYALVSNKSFVVELEQLGFQIQQQTNAHFLAGTRQRHGTRCKMIGTFPRVRLFRTARRTSAPQFDSDQFREGLSVEQEYNVVLSKKKTCVLVEQENMFVLQQEDMTSSSDKKTGLLVEQ